MIYEMSKVRNTSLSYIKNEAGNDSILAKILDMAQVVTLGMYKNN